MIQNSESFGATFQYSTGIKEGKKNLSKAKKSSWKKIFKSRKKWKDHAKKHGYGLPLLVILGLTSIFATLKLTQIIAWSWLWVLSPIWITIVLLILIIIYVMFVFLFMPEPPRVAPME